MTSPKPQQPLDVKCPTCGAEAGESCRWPRNVAIAEALYLCDPHRSRISLAMDRGMVKAT